MREIRKLTLEYLDEYVELAYNTYPSFKDNSSEGVENFKNLATLRITDPNSHFVGMFEDDKLLAAMRLIDFQMNFFGKVIEASGIASLAVHLMHKKEKIAKTMMEYYESFYKERNMPIASLLPFTPEFYKKMGYGLGPRMNQYRIPATRFPICYEKADLRFLKTAAEKKELLDFYENTIVSMNHGMLYKIADEVADLYENEDNRVIACYNEEGVMEGYFIFEFENGKEDNYTINNMIIKEFQYKNVEALNKMLGFIKKQDDQVNLVIFNTQDEYFANKFDNPLNDSLNYVDYGNLETNTQLIGPMYKILNIKQAFELYNYRNYNGVTLKVKFVIKDENNNNEEIVVHFKEGKVSTEENTYDIEVKMSIVDFSSLFMGCISIRGLYKLGLLSIDKEKYLDTLDLAFYCSQKPICNTDF